MLTTAQGKIQQYHRSKRKLLMLGNTLGVNIFHSTAVENEKNML